MSTKQPRVFISYKTGGNDTDGGHRTALVAGLHAALEARGFDVWRDREDLEVGLGWNDQLYDIIPQRDVLLLALTDATIASDWVKREDAVAKGAKVAIVPVFMPGTSDTGKVLSAFDLDKAQAARFTTGDAHEIDAIVKAIHSRAANTRKHQRAWLEAVLQHNDVPVIKKPVRPTNAKMARYRVVGVPNLTVWLAGGNLLDVPAEVLVNSENNYMQMARYYETRTVSCQLRLAGAWRRNKGTGDVREDTLQQLLHEQTMLNEEYGLPIADGSVVPTPAGHHKSQLRTSGVRFLFHAATVRFLPTIQDADPIMAVNDEGLAHAVDCCLKTCHDIDAAQGVFMPTGTQSHAQQVAAQASYTPIRSIAFPLLATGRGKREAACN